MRKAFSRLRRLRDMATFDGLKKILEFYVAALAVLGALAALNILSVWYTPECEELEPIYVFRLDCLLKVNQELGSRRIRELDSYTTTVAEHGPETLATWGILEGAHGFSRENIVPTEKAPGQIQGYVALAKSKELGYRLGLEERGPDSRKYYSAGRTKVEKRQGLAMMIEEAIEVKEGVAPKSIPAVITLEGGLSENPLKRISKIVKSEGGQAGYYLIKMLVNQMTILSAVSISNRSKQPINQLLILVSNVPLAEFVEVYGWTAIPSSIEVKTAHPNIRIAVDRLDAGNSFEILFRGSRAVRKDDVAISAAESIVNRRLVIVVMIVLFAVILFLYVFALVSVDDGLGRKNRKI